MNSKPGTRNMPFTTHVVIIRHGQSQGNAEGRFGGHTDTPLSARGRKQAAATASALASEKFDAVYSSDLPRAIETATPLANRVGIALRRKKHCAKAAAA